jgi:hypothetical protein
MINEQMNTLINNVVRQNIPDTIARDIVDKALLHCNRDMSLYPYYVNTSIKIFNFIQAKVELEHITTTRIKSYLRDKRKDRV